MQSSNCAPSVSLAGIEGQHSTSFHVLFCFESIIHNFISSLHHHRWFLFRGIAEQAPRFLNALAASSQRGRERENALNDIAQFNACADVTGNRRRTVSTTPHRREQWHFGSSATMMLHDDADCLHIPRPCQHITLHISISFTAYSPLPILIPFPGNSQFLNLNWAELRWERNKTSNNSYRDAAACIYLREWVS